MNRNKRKIILTDDSEEDDNFKHRRTSLQVNLSYSTELTDNGSCWKTEIANDEAGTNKIQANRRLSQSKNTHEKKVCQSFDFEDNESQTNNANEYVANDSGKSCSTKEKIQLKPLTINLEDICAKEKILDTNCKRLKDAILKKTKEMFDKQNQFSIKTMMVLGNETNQCLNSTYEIKTDARKSVIMLDTTIDAKNKTTVMEHTDNNQQKDKECSNISVTPTNNRQNSKRTLDKSRLFQKRLFVEPNKQKCRIIEDIVLRKSFSLLSLKQTKPGDSPILSSNKKFSSLRTFKSCLQNQFENHNGMAIQCDQSTNIGTPIVCSTFIDDNGIDGKRAKTVCEVDRETSCATCTTNKIVSMEITEIQDDIRTNENVLLQNKYNPNNCINNGIEEDSKTKENLKKRKNATMQRARDNIAHSYSSDVNIANNQDVKSIWVDTCISKQSSIEKNKVVKESHNMLSQRYECDTNTKNHNEKQCTSFLSDTDNTISSSLNVNTSLVQTVNKTKNVQKLSKCKIIDTNLDFLTTTNKIKEPIVLENQHETIDSVRTSLQMNMSVDSICKTWRRKNNYLGKLSVQDKNIDDLLMGNHSNVTNIDNQCLSEKKEENIDLLENISLIERLRNISTQKQVSETSCKKKTIDIRFNNKCQNSELMSNSRDSYVENTLYPIRHSILFKSHLKYKTQNLGDSAASNSNNINLATEKDTDKTKLNILYPKAIPNEMKSNETSKTNEINPVILKDIPSDNPCVTQDTLIISKDETTSKIEKEISIHQTTECIPKKKGRRKLLPLENSQLCSFSPVEENKCTSDSSISVKKEKILKKRCRKRKSADFKNNISVNRNIANEETESDSDYNVSKSKKRKEKKTRKPQKVVSKKIIIKKFAEENIMNMLTKNRLDESDRIIENADSLNDFVRHHTISTQWSKYKRSQKIIIVTTGLSKEDKNLVKNIIKSLGAAEMELNVSRRTTHVVSTGVRTVNLLRGIIRGCWLVTLEWVLKSLENNAWLDSEEFEMKHFSKAVQENRKDRQLFGASYMPELFTTCGFIYIEHKTTVPRDTLKELIKIAGGHITENVKFAKIIIGENGLKETWVIDSITTGELQLTKLYEKK